MRVLTTAGALAVIVGLAAVPGGDLAVRAAAGAVPPAALPPNLVMLPPSEATIETTLVKGRTRYLLRFTSDVANAGPGPLVLRSTRPSPAAPFATAQGFRLPDGRLRYLSTTAVVRFSADPMHGHTHVVGFERSASN